MTDLGDAGTVPDWAGEEPSDALMTPRRLARVWLAAALNEPRLEHDEDAD